MTKSSPQTSTTDREPCLRCAGKGWRYQWRPDGGICYRCDGSGLEPLREHRLEEALARTWAHRLEVEDIGHELADRVAHPYHLDGVDPNDVKELAERRAQWVALGRKARWLERELGKERAKPRKAAPVVHVAGPMTEEAYEVMVSSPDELWEAQNEPRDVATYRHNRSKWGYWGEDLDEVAARENAELYDSMTDEEIEAAKENSRLYEEEAMGYPGGLTPHHRRYYDAYGILPAPHVGTYR